MILKNAFDSHAHLLMTGQAAYNLQLNHLNTPDVSQIKNLNSYIDEGVLVGEGWDQNHFLDNKYPSRVDLDRLFPNMPVILSRIDGHASWVNTEALRRVGLFNKDKVLVNGGEILRDKDGLPTGILIDLACELMKPLLPTMTKERVKKYLLKGCDVFNQNGFTHIRDLTCDDVQWNALIDLDKNKELTLYIDQYFSVFNPKNFETQLQLAKSAKKESQNTIRVKGIKIWYDGALGSEGALISNDYLTRAGHKGLRLLSHDQLNETFVKTWRANLDLAIHVIGDQAADEVVTAALKVKEKGISGRLHLEHVELLRPETILNLKKLNVICHMQPCHWLDDKKWLHKKIGALAQYAFQWNQLEQNQITFDFGSDSPVSNPSLFKTMEAILDAEKNGISLTDQHPLVYHEYYDNTWAPNCFTQIHDQQIIKTVFNDRTIFSSIRDELSQK